VYTVLSILRFVRAASFGVAHWIFAFEYHTIQKITPYIIRGEEIPEKITRNHSKVNKTFLTLNIVLPFFGSTIFFFVYQTKKYNGSESHFHMQLTNLYLFMAFLNLALNLITGFVLSCAICNIKNYFRINKVEKKINIKIFAIHLATFILYMFSAVILVTFKTIFF
jgi:hypothetical protein